MPRFPAVLFPYFNAQDVRKGRNQQRLQKKVCLTLDLGGFRMQKGYFRPQSRILSTLVCESLSKLQSSTLRKKMDPL